MTGSAGEPRIAPPTGADGPRYGTPIDHAIEGFARAAMRADGIDAALTELVRLRCAGYHDCRVCGSLRMVDARSAGVDEAAIAQVADFEHSDLDAATKAALRLTEAIIVSPAAAGDALRADLRAHFTDDQIVEIALDVVKWSYQKVLVSLRIDTPPSAEGLTELAFDDEGRHSFGELLPSGSAEAPRRK